ncbi:MAG: hypothetical protein M3T56_12500 [Chloroflexota bacterium]|nr:hypothetical protein [Chloroflexota bacterium]
MAPVSTVKSRVLLRVQLLQRRSTGGAWFYWIGAVSIVNSVLNAAGTQWGLSVALGITHLIDGLAAALSNTAGTPMYAFAVDIAVAGGFMLIGRAARRGNLGWYAVGIFLYLLDSILFIVVKDILGIAVHAIAIYGFASGWRAARSLKQLDTPTPALVG